MTRRIVAQPRKLFEQLGRDIAEAREARELSQQDLAAKIGLTQSVIAQLELGQRNPTIATLLTVAKGLGLKLNVEIRR